MAKLGQSSFRRILLTRLLLLSVPVLLMGVYLTYRKARSTLLKTAGQNLTESAARKGESIQEIIAALQSNLISASENVVFKSHSPAGHQKFVEELAQQLPPQIQCVQLSNLQTKAVVASTCGTQFIEPNSETLWFQERGSTPITRSQVDVRVLLPQDQPPSETGNINQLNAENQLKLVFSAPVYNAADQLQYALSIQSALLQPKETPPGSLTGYPVVISQSGTILAHPSPDRVGRNIEQEIEAEPLQRVLRRAIAGQQAFEHLFYFEQNNVELLAGYTSITSPVTGEANQKWIILAVTHLDSALAGLKDIQQVLFILTCCLIAASLLATYYIAHDLAMPLEKLTDYALNDSQLHSTDKIPRNFNIREFNQLSEALEGMISRLRHWAEELETAWKEAQTANQLKNEFLANTSHELRTPLNGIIGCLRLVRDGFCDDKEEELDFLQRADDAAIHLLGIINDVLDIAKIEAGKLSVEMESIDLRKLLNEVINLQAVPIQEKSLQFNTTDLHDIIPVRADPAKLKQVLLNVVSNAVKFTDAGSITISTRIEPIAEQPMMSSTGNLSPSSRSLYNLSAKKAKATNTDQGNDYANSQLSSSQVFVTVKDTGIGIDPTQQHKLFRPFVMVDGSTTRKCGGTGLGLAISRNLIELMGGSITLSSEGDGQGTTVEISLLTIEPSLLLTGDSQGLNGVTPMSSADSNGAVTQS